MTSPPELPVADLHASIDRWRAWSDRAKAVETAPRVMLVEGRDSRGAVTVRIDERWRVVAIRLRNTWRDVVDPAALGAAVIEAVGDAVGERLRPSIEVLVDVDALPGAEMLAALTADDADLGAEVGGLRGLRRLGSPALSIDAVEAQLADIDKVLSEQESSAPPTVTGWSRRHEVEIELGLAGLPVRVECRLEWVRSTSVDRLTSALAEAFVEAYAAADDQLTPGSLPGAA